MKIAGISFKKWMEHKKCQWNMKTMNIVQKNQTWGMDETWEMINEQEIRMAVQWLRSSKKMQESLLGYGCDILNFNISLLPHLLIDVKRRMLPPSLKVGKSSSWVPTMVMVKVDRAGWKHNLARNSRRIGWWWSVEPCICWRFPFKKTKQ